MENKNNSNKGEHITVINEGLIDHPKCIHGPTLLFKKTFDSGAKPIEFYACSAFRNHECSVLTNNYKKQINVRPAHLQKAHSKSTDFGLAEITKQSPKKRAYCHTCACLFSTNEKNLHQNHDSIIGISDELLRQPTHFLKPLANDSREAQYFFANSTLKCFVNIFKHLGFRRHRSIWKYLIKNMPLKLHFGFLYFGINILVELNVLNLQLAVDAWRPFNVLHSNVSAVSFSENIFINASIDKEMRLNIYFQSLIDISKPFLNAAVLVDSGNGLYDLEYINRTINVCRLLTDSKYEPFLQLVVRTTLPSSNFPKKCPFGKKIFFVRNLKPNPEEFPPVLPEKKCYLSIKLLSKTNNHMEPLLAYRIYFEIKNNV